MVCRLVICSALLLISSTSVLGQIPFFGQNPCKSKGCGPGEFIPVPGGFFFGKECKSKGCGILRGPGGDIFFGGGCKSKGCPIPPGFPIPGLPPSPVPRPSRRPPRTRPPRVPTPICCTPNGCLRGYRTQCMAGALTPSLASLGYYSASGSCSGQMSKFKCARAEVICSGNRGRCVFKKCPGRQTPRPRPSGKPRHSPKPGYKTQYPHRLLNTTAEMEIDLLGTQRQTAGFCKSKGCPFGPPEQIIFGGACKSKGCGVVNTPGGPLFFGGACKSKGCPVPPGFVVAPSPLPPRRPRRPRRPRQPRPRASPLPPLPLPVPPFVPPRSGLCCFARPCRTQRICRCILSAFN